jgi:hypothetical protein
VIHKFIPSSVAASLGGLDAQFNVSGLTAGAVPTSVAACAALAPLDESISVRSAVLDRSPTRSLVHPSLLSALL